MERTKGPKSPKPTIEEFPIEESPIEQPLIEEAPIDEIPVRVVIDPLPAKEIHRVEPSPEIPVRLKLKYRKVGGGSLTIFKRAYKQNDILEAYPEQIPESFRDTLVCISTVEEQKQAIAESKGVFFKEFLYTVAPSTLAGFFNVINTETKKQINEKMLSNEDARRLCDTLNI